MRPSLYLIVKMAQITFFLVKSRANPIFLHKLVFSFIFHLFSCVFLIFLLYFTISPSNPQKSPQFSPTGFIWGSFWVFSVGKPRSFSKSTPPEGTRSGSVPSSPYGLGRYLTPRSYLFPNVLAEKRSEAQSRRDWAERSPPGIGPAPICLAPGLGLPAWPVGPGREGPQARCPPSEEAWAKPRPTSEGRSTFLRILRRPLRGGLGPWVALRPDPPLGGVRARGHRMALVSRARLFWEDISGAKPR